jgi:CRP/FNR family transcriptional regulator, anaerobic regulatory protein
MTTAPPPLEKLIQLVTTKFPALAQLPPSTIARMVAAAEYRQMAAGDQLFSPDTPCGGFPLLLEGRVRVVREAPNGRSITLYTVEAGEICIASAQAMFHRPGLVANGYAETAVSVLVLSPETVDALLASEADFRKFFFGLISERLSDLMLAVEAIAFLKLDQRLARLLVERGPRLAMTHQAIADQLGVAREMVSRVMRSFSERGWISQSREAIEVVDVAALDEVSQAT